MPCCSGYPFLISVSARATRRRLRHQGPCSRTVPADAGHRGKGRTPRSSGGSKDCCPRLSLLTRCAPWRRLQNNKAVSVLTSAVQLTTPRCCAVAAHTFLQDVVFRPFGVGRSLVRKLFAFAVDVFFRPPSDVRGACGGSLWDPKHEIMPCCWGYYIRAGSIIKGEKV